MMRLARLALLGLALLMAAAPAQAVEPSEMLADPALEARARELSKGLRCLVCRNENIDDSNAELARDLRILVRERLVAGDSDDEVITYLVERYGEYVLLKPTAQGGNLVLWIAGPVMLLIALLGAGAYLRRRAGARSPAEAALSEDEEARLAELMREE